MPVCQECGRYWAPRQAVAGRCRDCGGPIALARSPGGDASAGVGGVAGGAVPEGDEAAAVKEKLPWHLKLLAVSFCLYLGWRIVQGVQWLIRHL